MRIPSLVLALSLPAAGLWAQAPVRLDLNIPSLQLVVYEGDRAVETYRVAVGKPGHDTPSGSFTIDHAEWNPWWRPPEREWAKNEKVTPPGPRNPMGRVKLFFEPLYFIHGTPESQSIGTPASHGCVRMRDRDVVELARQLHRLAAPGFGDAQIDRILRSGQTRRVNFRSGIPLVVRYDLVEVIGGEILVYPDIYRRNALHLEGVYQALLSAGYDVRGLASEDVRRFLEKAAGRKSAYRVPVEEAFGVRLAATGSAVTTR